MFNRLGIFSGFSIISLRWVYWHVTPSRIRQGGYVAFYIAHETVPGQMLKEQKVVVVSSVTVWHLQIGELPGRLRDPTVKCVCESLRPSG